MLKVSIIIPAWNEKERIVDCLDNATRQTVMPHEVLVVDNRSTDHTVEIVERYIAEHPDLPVKLLHQDEEQGLIPTRNYGLNHATGDILGRVDADCMLKPDWVEVVRGIFTEDAEAMGATGPVTYYDMPAHKIALRGDDSVRRHTYRADGGQVLLFGSNMALRASAWKLIHDEVCLDKEDVMHEDIDISLHLLGRGLKTVYSGRMICGISARRMDTSFKSFRNYMRRFKNTFAAHPEHWRNHKSERTLYLMYPWLHAMFPIYRQYLESKDINPAVRIWFRTPEQKGQLPLGATEADIEAAKNADPKAAAEAVVKVQHAFDVLGDDIPQNLRAAGQLRIDHPDFSLEELGRAARPQISKDAVAGRIRRLLQRAEKAEQDAAMA